MNRISEWLDGLRVIIPLKLRDLIFRGRRKTWELECANTELEDEIRERDATIAQLVEQLYELRSQTNLAFVRTSIEAWKVDYDKAQDEIASLRTKLRDANDKIVGLKIELGEGP